MHDKLTGQKRVRHAVVVDRVAQRLHHLRLAENRVALVRRQVDQCAARVAVDGYLFVAVERLDQVGREVAAISTSPRSSSSRWEDGSGTWRRITRRTPGAPWR